MKVADLQRSTGMNPIQTGRARKKPGRLPGMPDGLNDVRRNSFADVLKEKLGRPQGVKFSAHAMRRLDESRVNLTDRQLQRLDEGVRKVAEKGARDSLILLDNVAYVVSVKNQTVVTAVGQDRATNNVFTNIDSVVIV